MFKVAYYDKFFFLTKASTPNILYVMYRTSVGKVIRFLSLNITRCSRWLAMCLKNNE